MQPSRKSSQLSAVGALKLFCQRPVPVKPSGNQPAPEPWRPVMLHSLGDPTNRLCFLSNRFEHFHGEVPWPHSTGLSANSTPDEIIIVPLWNRPKYS